MAIPVGNISSVVETYSTVPCTQYTSTCLRGFAPCERVKMCVTIEKASYNAAVFECNESGTFDSNILQYSMSVLDSDPVNGQSYPPSPIAGQTIQIFDSEDNFTFCTTFRIPEDWINTLHYITFGFRFQMSDHIDTIYYPISMTVGEYVTPNSVTVTDQDGNEVIEGQFCGSELEEVRLDFILGDPDLSLQNVNWYVHKSNGTIDEYNGYFANCLPQIESDIVLYGDSEVAPVSPTYIVLDPTLLPIGENCVKLVAKSDEIEVCPPCTSFDGTITATVTMSNPLQQEVTIDYDFSGITSTLLFFEINGTYYTSLTGSYTMIIPWDGVLTNLIELPFHVVIHGDPCAFYIGDENITLGRLLGSTETITVNMDCEECCDEIIECCDYTTLWEEIIFDLSITHNGSETPLNLPGPFYAPSLIMTLIVDVNAALLALGYDPVTMTWNANGGEMLVITSCVPFVTKIGVNPSMFIESNCETLLCDNSPGIIGTLNSDCLDLAMFGNNSPVDSQTIEWSNDGGLTWNVGTQICDCDLRWEWECERRCINLSTNGGRAEVGIVNTCGINQSSLVLTRTDQDGDVVSFPGVGVSGEGWGNGGQFDAQTGGWREYMFEMTSPGGVLRCTTRFTHTDAVNNLTCGDNFIMLANPNGNDVETINKEIMVRGNVSYLDECPPITIPEQVLIF